MEMNSLRELYIAELKDLYSAERQLVQALPKMAKNATNPQLQQAFENHLEEGLIDEGKELIEEDAQEDVLDAGLISKAQHVEHYEIAGYGTVRTYAEILGESRHAQLLQQTLEEEAAADRLLTELAGSINIDAAIGDEAETSRGLRGDREVARAAELDRPAGESKSGRIRPSEQRSTREVRDR